MHGEENQGMTDVNQTGLSQGEARELQAHLDTEGWAALLAVQRAFASAPMLAPSAGFGDRVLQKLAVRERQRAWRRSVAGIIAFSLGSTIFTAFLLWLSPLSGLTQASGWAELLNTFASFVDVLAVVLEIAATFTQVLAKLLGDWIVLGFSLFALLLTILWTRIVAGWTPLNRPEPV
jgi:hypothetical protein